MGTSLSFKGKIKPNSIQLLSRNNDSSVPGWGRRYVGIVVYPAQNKVGRLFEIRFIAGDLLKDLPGTIPLALAESALPFHPKFT